LRAVCGGYAGPRDNALNGVFPMPTFALDRHHPAKVAAPIRTLLAGGMAETTLLPQTAGQTAIPQNLPVDLSPNGRFGCRPRKASR
jgi:hypothetical protein